jgi:hypothetical protein
MLENDVKRSTVDEVYSLILSDLDYAEGKLPDSSDQVGRPTKWAAKTLLADVCLHLKRYQEARDKAAEVIASNKFSLVPVSSVEDFQEKVFGPTLVSTSEEIFYFKYSRQAGQGNYLMWIINHEATGVFKYGGAYAVFADAANPLYQNWDDNDLRKGLLQNVDFGVRPTTLVTTKFGDKEPPNQNGGGNDDPVYGYPDLLLIYAEAANAVANGPTAEAMEAVNKVHRRAYGYDSETSSPIDFQLADYNVNSFLDLVLRERLYEFNFEGKRWHDLKRTGKARDFVLTNKGITVEDACFLWSIPVSEMNYNKALDPKNDQNPGY